MKTDCKIISFRQPGKRARNKLAIQFFKRLSEPERQILLITMQVAVEKAERDELPLADIIWRRFWAGTADLPWLVKAVFA